MNCKQCRAARALLGWSAKDLADVSGVHHDTIHRFESGKDILLSNVQKVRSALLDAGIEFIGDNGVRLKKD